MDRLELVPGDVRGGGNITISKDFINDVNTSTVDTVLSESSETIDGREMSIFSSDLSNSLYASISAPRLVAPGDTVSVSVSVTGTSGVSVSGVSVLLELRSSDGEIVYWSDTVSSSSASFSVSVPDSVDSTVCQWFARCSHSSLGSVSVHKSVLVTDWSMDFDVVADTEVIQTGDVANVVGLCTVTNGEEVIGVPGQTVNLYETFTPGLRVSANPVIIQTGETSNITAQLIDTVDGSLVRESGVNVNVYQESSNILIEEWPATGYQTPYNDTPLEIYGQMKKNGNWGGLRIYGADNDHHYCYIGQGSATNDENAKIFYKIGDDWTDFIVDIWRDKVALYIGSHKVEEVSCDISEPVSVWGGSTANPVSVQNLRIRDITAE